MPKTNDIAVLDIGSKKITVLIGEKTNKDIYNIKGFGECNYSGFSGGQWFSQDDLRAAVAKAMNIAEVDAGVKIKKLYIGVPAEFCAVACKEVSLVKAKNGRVSDADINALYQKGDTFSANPQFITINYSSIYYTLDDAPRRYVEARGLIASKLTGFVSYILCEKSFCELFENIVADLRLKEIEYVCSSWAEAISLFTPEQRAKYLILADIGYITSSVAIVREDGLLNLASFSLGGGHIESDLTMLFEIPFDIAREVKSKVDISLEYSDDAFYEAGENGKYHLCANDVNEVVRARLDTFIEYINEGLNYSEYDCPKFATVYLTGGGVSAVRGAKEYIAAKLKKSVEIIAPSIPRFNKPHYSSAISTLDVASTLSGNKQGAVTAFFKNIFAKIGG